MFKPHVTVAGVVCAHNQFLMVEERINGLITWNQPAGHLEANETLIDAMRRELYEESGLQAHPDFLLAIHQWIAPDSTAFLRFLFGFPLESRPPTSPKDADIIGCRWLSADAILTAGCLRSPLVAESIRLWQHGRRYPLSLLNAFQWPFAEGAPLKGT